VDRQWESCRQGECLETKEEWLNAWNRNVWTATYTHKRGFKKSETTTDNASFLLIILIRKKLSNLFKMILFSILFYFVFDFVCFGFILFVHLFIFKLKKKSPALPMRPQTFGLYCIYTHILLSAFCSQSYDETPKFVPHQSTAG